MARYYRALNNTLNHDIDGPALRSAIPLLGAMVYDLCCFVDGTPRRFEHDTRVWKVSRTSSLLLFGDVLGDVLRLSN